MTMIWPQLKRLLRDSLYRIKRVTWADTGADTASLTLAIRKTELFCNADASLVHAMLDRMQGRSVRRGDVILRQGTRSDRFVLLVSGSAEVTRSREGGRAARSLAVLTEQVGLGEEALLGAEIRSVTVTMLTDGTVLEIKRADFARLIVEQGVQWVAPEKIIKMKPSAALIWIGAVNTRPRGLGADVLGVSLERLRGWLSELDPQQHYLCCGKDDGNSGLAAFLLMQRGFKASAVHDWRRAVARE